MSRNEECVESTFSFCEIQFLYSIFISFLFIDAEVRYSTVDNIILLLIISNGKKKVLLNTEIGFIHYRK